MDAPWLTRRFEENRARLRAIALRMLGSPAEADDAVQETWLRLHRAGGNGIDNLGGWLTTVVARVCLDALRARASRPDEEPVEEEPVAGAPDPERDALLADSVGAALLVLLDALGPLERVAFVLHDLFGLPFDEIAPILGRSPAAARQLASRARRRVRGAPPSGRADRTLVDAFLAASRNGDFDALLALLAPDAEFHADDTAVAVAAAHQWGGPGGLAREVHGARPVAETLKDRARGAQPALIDGAPGAVWAPGGQVRSVFAFTVAEGRIARIDLWMDPARLAGLTIKT